MVNDVTAINPELPPPVPEKRVWGGWATFGLGIVILMIYGIVQTVVALVGLVVLWLQRASFSGVPYDDLVNGVMDVFRGNMGLLQSLATIISGIAGIGLVALFIKARGRAGFAEYLGLRRFRAREMLLVFVIVIIFLALSAGLSFWTGADDQGNVMVDIYNSSVWPPLLWIAVVVFAPAFEEVFFRGFLFEGFRQSPVGSAGAIIFTSVAWALLHALQYGLVTLASIFILGVVMGVVRLKTKSLWNTIVMHALVNIVGMLEIALNIDKLFR